MQKNLESNSLHVKNKFWNMKKGSGINCTFVSNNSILDNKVGFLNELFKFCMEIMSCNCFPFGLP
jgi:hypothetical protein